MLLLGLLLVAAVFVIPFLIRAQRDRSSDTLFEAYENGKHRRYTLLFAANGGAFALVEFAVKDFGGSSLLPIDHIAAGMLLFTAIMCFDILALGLKMRAKWLDGQQPASRWAGIFALPGRVVLGALWLLISAGWILARTSCV